jgi:hypothetical protein
MEMFNWSFSRLKSYLTCPTQYYELQVARNFQQTEHPTTVWGTRGHLALEHRVRDKTPLPSEFAYLESLAVGIESLPGTLLCEHELAVDKELNPCAFDSPLRWVRGIIDVLSIDGENAIAIDYKFGKVKPSSQLKLMALLVFAAYLEVQTVKSRFLWIQFREKTSAVYNRADEKKLWQEFIDDAAQMEEADALGIYPPKPSGLCRPNGKGYAGCPVTTCEFYGKGSRRY